MTGSGYNPLEFDSADRNISDALKGYKGPVIVIDRSLGVFPQKTENLPNDLELEVERELFRESEGQKIVFFNQEGRCFYGELGRVTRDFVEIRKVYGIESDFKPMKDDFLKDFIEKEKPATHLNLDYDTNIWDEILYLYNWWTNVRPNRINLLRDPTMEIPPIEYITSPNHTVVKYFNDKKYKKYYDSIKNNQN